MFNIPEITAADLRQHKDDYILVDVREPDELIGPQGQIAGVLQAPLGSTLAHFLVSNDPTQSYVFICRSGIRSAHACEIAHAYSYHRVYNLKGGMLAWNAYDA